jgi:hypothetical protein
MSKRTYSQSLSTAMTEQNHKPTCHVLTMWIKKAILSKSLSSVQLLINKWQYSYLPHHSLRDLFTMIPYDIHGDAIFHFLLDYHIREYKSKVVKLVVCLIPNTCCPYNQNCILRTDKDNLLIRRIFSSRVARQLLVSEILSVTFWPLIYQNYNFLENTLQHVVDHYYLNIISFFFIEEVQGFFIEDCKHVPYLAFIYYYLSPKVRDALKSINHPLCNRITPLLKKMVSSITHPLNILPPVIMSKVAKYHPQVINDIMASTRLCKDVVGIITDYVFSE